MQQVRDQVFDKKMSKAVESMSKAGRKPARTCRKPGCKPGRKPGLQPGLGLQPCLQLARIMECDLKRYTLITITGRQQNAVLRMITRYSLVCLARTVTLKCTKYTSASVQTGTHAVQWWLLAGTTVTANDLFISRHTVSAQLQHSWPLIPSYSLSNIRHTRRQSHQTIGLCQINCIPSWLSTSGKLLSVQPNALRYTDYKILRPISKFSVWVDVSNTWNARISTNNCVMVSVTLFIVRCTQAFEQLYSPDIW